MKPKTNKKSKKGFTLVELIIVVAILGMLAIIALPRYSRYVQSAKWERVNSNAKTVYNAMVIVEADLIAEGVIRLSNPPTYGTSEYSTYYRDVNAEFYKRVSAIMPSDVVIGRLSVPSDPYDPDDLKNYYINYLPSTNPKASPKGEISVDIMLTEWEDPVTNVVHHYKYFTWVNGVYTSMAKPF